MSLTDAYLIRLNSFELLRLVIFCYPSRITFLYMVSVSPWSVKGVEPEAREAAKIAARRSAMTVGQWLSQTIRAAAAQQLDGTSQPLVDTSPPPPQPAPEQALQGDNSLASQGSYPVESLRAVEAGHNAPPPVSVNEAIRENIPRLNNPIEDPESKSRAAISSPVDQVEQLSERVEQVRAQSPLSTAPVERAVSRLSERLEKIEAARRTQAANRRWSLFSNND